MKKIESKGLHAYGRGGKTGKVCPQVKNKNRKVQIISAHCETERIFFVGKSLLLRKSSLYRLDYSPRGGTGGAGEAGWAGGGVAGCCQARARWRPQPPAPRPAPAPPTPRRSPQHNIESLTTLAWLLQSLTLEKALMWILIQAV